MRSFLREIEAHLAALRQTPALIAEVSAGLSEAQLRQPPVTGEWSMAELLAHLHACAGVWGDDIERMLAEDVPTFTKPHPRQVMKEARFLAPPFAEALGAFTAARTELLYRLELLGPVQWERTAVINRRVHTVFTQIRRMALHEAEHEGQFRAIRGKITGLGK